MLNSVPARVKLRGAAPEDDPDTLKSKSKKGFYALKIVTAAAHAVANTNLAPIPVLTTDNADINANQEKISTMLTAVRNNLDTAKGTADQWLETGSGLNDRMSSMIPTHILDFSATFDAVMVEIDELVTKGEQPGADQQALKRQLVDLINDGLLGSLNGYQQEITTATADLEAYRKRVQTDHDHLSDSSDSIQDLINLENGEVEQLKSDVQRLHDEIAALNRQIMDAEIGLGVSIFVGVIGVALCATGVGAVAGGAVVAVGAVGIAASAIVWGTLQAQVNHDYSKITDDESDETKLKTQIASLTALHMTVSNLVGQIVEAQTALSDVGVFWTNFAKTLNGIIDELKKPSTNLALGRDKFLALVAYDKWKELKDFAEVLVTVPVEVQAFQPKAA